MSLTTPNEYTGIYKISTDQFSAAVLQSFINQNETDALVNLFGVELYNLFIADLDVSNVPQSERFLAIYNAFVEQVSSNTDYYHRTSCIEDWGYKTAYKYPIAQSYGIKDMLCGFVYYTYNSSNDVQATPVGNRTLEASAAGMSSNPLRNARLTDAYNRAVKSYQAIQWYMSQSSHKDDYPEYAGVPRQAMYMGGAL